MGEGIADGDVAGGIRGADPISNGQLAREEIEKGIELFGVDTTEHIQVIIDVLKANKEELGI